MKNLFRSSVARSAFRHRHGVRYGDGSDAGSACASAHAVVVHSSPAINETVQGPDVEITVKFNSRVDGKRSSLLLSTSDSQSKPLTIEQQSAPIL